MPLLRPALSPVAAVGVSDVLAQAARLDTRPPACPATGLSALELGLEGTARPEVLEVEPAEAAAAAVPGGSDAPPFRVQREMLALRRLKTDLDLAVTAAA